MLRFVPMTDVMYHTVISGSCLRNRGYVSNRDVMLVGKCFQNRQNINIFNILDLFVIEVIGCFNFSVGQT